MHNKNRMFKRYSIFRLNGFFVTAGILTILAGCRERSDENGINGTNGITGGAFISSASCSTTDSRTLNIDISNTTGQTLILKEGGVFFSASLVCSIFTSADFGATPVGFCSAVPFSINNGTPTSLPLPIGTTAVPLSCTTDCVNIKGIACEGQAYAQPSGGPTPGLAFELDNIFGTIPSLNQLKK